MSPAIVSNLIIYPVKSTAGLSLPQAELLTSGLVGDRRYLITKPDGTFVTGRTHPKITSIRSNYHGEILRLTQEDMIDLVLDPAGFSESYLDTSVWGTELIGQICGDKADDWISTVLGEPLRLLYFGNRSERYIKQHPDCDVSFADGYPLLLIGDSSLAHLNNRLPAPVSMANFRPNITVSGSPAFEEDGWSLIRIGDVRFELPKACARCVFTTVDPHAHVADKTLEPLRTLTSYRQRQNSRDVLFGENMIPLNSGSIRIGDPVEVLKTKTRPVYIDNWLPSASRLSQQMKPPAAKDFLNSPVLLRCVQIIQETHDIRTFKFIADPQQRFDYKAGQFLTLFVPIDGKVVSRCYTISSSPSRPDSLTITVKRVTGGKVSNWLHDHLAIGSTLEAQGPSGQFHLQENQPRQLLLLSGGSGITPMLSMLRFITDNALDFDIHFHHSARRNCDLVSWQELTLLARQVPGLKLSFNTSQEKPDTSHSNKVFEGRLTRDKLIEVCPDLLERSIFVCGPDAFMKTAQEDLRILGLPDDQYEQESFSIVPLAPPEDARGESYKIHFTKSGVTTEIKGNQTVLTVAEASGIDAPYSCRGGICGTCKQLLVSGSIAAPNAMGLSNEEVDTGFFLPCCSFPRSDLSVDI
ncbi:hybrid-cluster NAD(P)-dependent oxidoreductase [Kiloniella laminariae]|uniref:Hybrid-cluster NAD(P)-dependent oxidoreductase n=1 Tax=Kiloniella laminariae TaxID=454162 RepID=A0ABT4LL15_9PROT|nr:hybrid-cluster NAD(P)-dependent oxidoreductase [Kiloniella laminariae]MCZ4281056.1 hybrid-cluster NAD(P)-dependent oxidoreductase [Kiloniella laminariae]